MPKGERRRRRQGEQENAAPSSGAEPSLDLDRNGGQDESGEPSVAQSEAPESGGAESQSDSAQIGAPRRVALAEVLAKPVFPNVPPERVIPPPKASDDFFARSTAQKSFAADEDAQQPQTPESEAYAPPSDSSFESSGRPVDLDSIEGSRERRNREPVIVALLLAALVILLVNTYFIMRLNGLSDRLGATVASTAAAPLAAGERPWVGVDKVTTVPFANGGQPVTTVHIVNSGHEPAYDLRSNTAGSLRSASTPAPDVPAQKGQLAVTALLMPNVGGNLTFFANTRALTAAEAANVRSGQYVLWLTGRLDYKDSHGHPHLTTFRDRYNPALNTFVATPQGNNAN
jgi:hypothetical protein